MSEFVEVLNAAVEQGPATAAVIGGGLGLRKVVGPSLDAVGETLGKFTRYRAENLLRIGEKVAHRLDDDDDDNQVHPRVAKALLDEGSWLDDEVAQEYFAGMLIGARSADGREGESAYYARLAATLTAGQLRLHHLMYRTLLGVGPGLELRTRVGVERIKVHLPVSDLQSHVHLLEGSAATMALYREGLVGEYAYDLDGDLLDSWFRPATGGPAGPGLAFTPTTMGVLLFLRAYGFGAMNPNELTTMISLPDTLQPMPTAQNPSYGPGVLGR